MNFSLIIPVAPLDNDWKTLIADLIYLDSKDECLFVSPVDLNEELNDLAKKAKLDCSVKWIYSDQGRAKQQNTGVKNAVNDFLWFVHCDTRLSVELFRELKNNLHQEQNAIYYFNLKFTDDVPLLMKLNELGVYVRSNLLRMPFGDQAFCMSKGVFYKLGQFDEKASFGEDHLLIWKAHQYKIKTKCIPKSVTTSSRKYKQQGWSKTTLKHLKLTYTQAIPQFIKLLTKRDIK